MLQVRRFTKSETGRAVADMIYDEENPPPCVSRGAVIVDPMDPTRRKKLDEDMLGEDILVAAFRGGRRVYDPPGLEAARARLEEDLARFHAGVKRFVNPHQYPVGLEKGLHERKTAIILKARGEVG